MKTWRVFLVVVWMLASALLSARQPAQVRLYCNSLRFRTATAIVAGQTYTFEITTAEGFSEINGELAPLFSTNLPSHGALFRMNDPNFPDPITGRIAFNQPDPVDDNGNGFDDFFEVAQPVSASAKGFFVTSVDNGTVVATWSRAAGSSIGTCRLRLTGSKFGQLPEFTHTFELLEFVGKLDYVPGTNHITGTLKLTQTGSPTNLLSGATTFTRVPTNRFDEVLLLPGSLVNSAGQALTYSMADLTRDDLSKTNYYGFVDFADGDLNTSTADYQDWVVSIDDPNDSNVNGIPDLTDDPAPPGPRHPQISLMQTPNQLLLSISGDIGNAYDVEGIISLGTTNWVRSLSITLTNDPQVVPLPLPDTQTRFWRVRRQ